MKKTPERISSTSDKLSQQKKIRRYQIALILLAVVVVVESALIVLRFFSAKEQTEPFLSDLKAPYYEKIMEIIEPLVYSGIPDLLRDEVHIRINFDDGVWTLENVHRFDPEGNVVLIDDKYGVCGELAAFTYQKIKPLIGNSYDIHFLVCAEAGYFPSALGGTHIILRLRDNKALMPDEFYLDPSFKIYGPFSHFENYIFLQEQDNLSFLVERRYSDFSELNDQTPILIRDNFRISFGVIEVNGQFDRNNFAFIMTATERYKYAGRIVLSLRLIDGQLQILEDSYLVNKIFKKQEYNKLRQKIIDDFNAISPLPVKFPNKFLKQF